MRILERGAMRFRVGEQLFLGGERRVFVGVHDLRRVDLGELVAEQVDRARAQMVVATDRGHLVVDSPPLAARDEQRGARRCRRLTRVAVEQRALLGRNEQRLVRVLAVQVDERAGRARRARPRVARRPSM